MAAKTNYSSLESVTAVSSCVIATCPSLLVLIVDKVLQVAMALLLMPAVQRQMHRGGCCPG